VIRSARRRSSLRQARVPESAVAVRSNRLGAFPQYIECRREVGFCRHSSTATATNSSASNSGSSQLRISSLVVPHEPIHPSRKSCVNSVLFRCRWVGHLSSSHLMRRLPLWWCRLEICA
jgi:hypothetical protein